MAESVRDLLIVVSMAMGAEIKPAAAGFMAEVLSEYPFDSVRVALKRCVQECKRLTVKDVLDRLPGGHPGPEEAWAIVARSFDESKSLVWTDEMRRASAPAAELVSAGDRVGARMAFKETYQALVAQAGGMPEWSFDGGTDYSAWTETAGRAFSEGKISFRFLRGVATDAAARLDAPALTSAQLVKRFPPPAELHPRDAERKRMSAEAPVLELVE